MKDQVITKLVFICDECHKKTKDYKNFKDFPYQEGWVYIHNISFKITKDKQEQIHDKHFCSQECMLIYVNKKLTHKPEGGSNNGK